MTESPDWISLSEILARKGIEQEHVFSLLECIDAPNKLIAFKRIAQNLIKVLRIFENIALKDRHIPEVVKAQINLCPGWREICAAIAAQPGSCFEAIPDFDKQPSKPDKAPITDYFLTHGLYVTLWYSAPTEELNIIYNQLLAQILYSFLLLRVREQEGEIFESSKYDALRSARNLSLQKNSSFLAQYPTSIDSPYVYLNMLGTITDNPWVQFHIVLLKNYATEGREGIIRDRSLYSRPAIEVDLPIINRDPEQIAGTPNTHILQMPALSRNEELELIESGCCEGEERAGVEILSHSYPGKQPMAGRTPAQHLRRMRGRAAQTASHNQQLPSRWENLSLHDVAHYIAAVSDVYNGSDDAYLQPDRFQDLELAAFLATIFWLGCPLKNIRKLKLYNVTHLRTATASGYVYRTDTNGYWLMKPARPSSDQPLTDDQRKQAVPVQELLPLESGLQVEAIIKRYVLEIRGVSDSTPQPLFPRSGLIYHRALSTFLSAVNQRHNCRLTAGRVSDHMQDAISNHPGSDLVVATLLTGRDHYLADSPLHYTALPQSHLQKTYRDVCTTIAQQAAKELGPNRTGMLLLSHGTSIMKSVREPHVGSHYRPERQVVKDLVATLQKSLDTATQKSWGLDRVLKLHNNLTLYTAIMFGFATGYRAVREPFFIDSQIDRHTGLALLTDKDSGDFYNARLVWLPSFCIEQYDLYQSHLESLKDRLMFLNNELFRRMHGHLKRHSKKMQVPLLFFFEKDRTETVLKPGLLRKVLRKVYSLRINANRHYLRSYLSEKGCPHHVISAFMGHWERGQEPFGRFSALSPMDYRDSLEQHLLPLLIEDGWKAMPGLGK